MANYGRDGAMRFDGNGGGSVNYEPNAFEDAPKQSGGAYQEAYGGTLPAEGASGTYAPPRHAEDDDFVQAGMLYRLMDEPAKQRLIGNLAGSLAQGTLPGVVDRSVGYFAAADPDLGERLTAKISAFRAEVA